ncbi:MAG: D-xylose transport system ATP-binding protein, partial [Solirubrobacteraceae bacterium]|nr:D-xylose transport system ATP-binding protein [Solirubrobacteraceae bacterium]
MSTSESRPAGEAKSSSQNGSGALLELRHLTKTFGPVRALTEVDLKVPPGKVTALVGDNGAGKSSLIKTISGLWAPD